MVAPENHALFVSSLRCPGTCWCCPVLAQSHPSFKSRWASDAETQEHSCFRLDSYRSLDWSSPDSRRSPSAWCWGGWVLDSQISYSLLSLSGSSTALCPINPILHVSGVLLFSPLGLAAELVKWSPSRRAGVKPCHSTLSCLCHLQPWHLGKTQADRVSNLSSRPEGSSLFLFSLVRDLPFYTYPSAFRTSAYLPHWHWHPSVSYRPCFAFYLVHIPANLLLLPISSSDSHA